MTLHTKDWVKLGFGVVKGVSLGLVAVGKAKGDNSPDGAKISGEEVSIIWDAFTSPMLSAIASVFGLNDNA